MDRRTLLASAGAGLAGIGVIRLAQAVTPEEDDGRPLLGINLTPITYYTQSAFIDRIRTAPGEWTAQGGVKPQLGPEGYPISMGGANAVFTMVSLDPASARAPVLYELTHDGEAAFELGFGRIVSATREKTIFSYAGPGLSTALMYRSIGRTPPTHLTLIRQDHAKLFASGEIFTPEFLSQVTGFDTLRFMDWLATNGSSVTDALIPVSAPSYTHGVPIEIVIALANKTGAKPWLTLPHLASDALVMEVLAKLKAGLRPDIRPTIEYSNEVWNFGFPQARYAQDQAAALWGAGTPGATYYGYRSGQIAKLARGSGARIVLGCQTVVPQASEQVWKGVALSGASPRDFADWIIATYVNGTLTQPNGPTLGFMETGNYSGAITNVLYATGQGAMSVATMKSVYADHGKIATEHGLRLVAYEGNMHLNALPAFGPQRDQVVAFFKAMSEDPESLKVFRANLDAFKAAGGQLACLFNLSTAAAGGGVFGLLDKPAWGYIRKHLERSAALAKP
jgi:hypothetical protein